MFGSIGGAFLSFYDTLFYIPLYNGLVFLINLIPGGDIGIAIIFLTIFVRLVLYPLSKSSIQSQRKMKELQPEIDKIKLECKDKKDELAKRTMALYRDNNINPFSGLLFMFLQIPLIIALYQVFLSGGLPMVKPEFLYSFVSAPAHVSMQFLGLIDLSAIHNIPFAILAGVSQFFQAKFSLPAPKPKVEGEKPSFQDEFTRGMGLQMKYMLPLFIAFISYGLSGAVGLYWIVNNLFSIGQELKK